MIGKILNTFGTKLLAAILNLGLAIIISQVLGPEGKGQQGLIVASIAYILVFSNLIGGSAIVYLIPRYRKSQVLIPSYIWSIIMGITAYFILINSPLISKEFIWPLSILSVVNAFSGINNSILIGKEKIKKANLVSLMQPMGIVIYICFAFFIKQDKSIHAYIEALYASFIFAFLLSFILVLKEKSQSLDSSLKEAISNLVKYGFLNQLAHIFQLLSFRMSYYWLNELYSESEVGVYSNGVALIESVWLISRSISLVQYARISNSNDLKFAQNLSINLSKGAFIFSILIVLPLILLPSSFYEFIFGNGFADVSKVLFALAPGVILFNLSLIFDHYFSGIGKFHINTLASFIGFVIALISFSILIPTQGITGAGWASSISYSATFLIVFSIFMIESKAGFKSLMISNEDLNLFFGELKSVLKK